MFDYLSGIIRFGTSNHIIVDISGVGFSVQVTTHTHNQLTENQVAKIYTHSVFREENIKIYGFLNEQEREMFLRLQSISGIGPSLALNILSACNVQKLYEAILHEDVDFFRRIKGIGPKTASRIVLELKGSLKNIDVPQTSELDVLRSSATRALLSLGYQEIDASSAVQRSLSQENKPSNLEALIYQALQILQNRTITRS